MKNLQNQDLLRTQAYVNGQWIGADDGKTFPVTNPFDGNLLANIADCGAAETKRAIEAAHQAGLTWGQLPARQRIVFLKRWAELINQSFDDLTQLLTLEQGKPLAQAKGEIEFCITLLEWFSAEALRMHGQTITAPDQTTRYMTIKQPIGVVAAISPWNFPSICMTKSVPAIAAGCTVVLKPAQDTPLLALALARLAEQAGLPAGVFNVITCLNPEPVGTELAANPLVRKIAFTGSTHTGKLLAKQAAETVKRLGLELGGNCPFIIFADANIDAAVDQAIGLKFFNAGQVCVSNNRILVEDSVYDEVVRKFTEKAKQLTLGSGLDSSTTVGPLINEKGMQKVQRLVKDAQQKGATVKLGGQVHAQSPSIYEPTILTDVPTNAAIYHEEVFGPVAAFYRFRTEAEAITMANDTPYGLAAYFFSRDPDKIRRVSENLEAGSIGVNSIAIYAENVPFGGVKESGIGREGGVVNSLEPFYETKTLAIG